MKHPLAVPDLGGNEEDYVVDAIRSSWISSQGGYLERFEQEFAEVCGTRHAITVSNGTVALHLALVALGIGPGDEVIVPSLTYVASVNAISYVGATPIFVDIEQESWCLDPLAVKMALSPKTRAIIAVHLYGQPANMNALRTISELNGLHLVEDAAEAPLATYHGRPTGGLGDIGTFSFYGNKLLTSGEGGAITLDDDDLARRARGLRGQGMDPNRRYWFPVVGYNYRLTNVAAALLCAQLERRKEFLIAREAIYERYTSRLGGVPGIAIQHQVKDTVRSPWLYSIIIEDSFGLTRDELAAALGDCGIETRPFFPPVHLLPPYQQPGSPLVLPVTERVAAAGMNLPTHSAMSLNSVDEVCEQVLLLARV